MWFNVKLLLHLRFLCFFTEILLEMSLHYQLNHQKVISSWQSTNVKLNWSPESFSVICTQTHTIFDTARVFELSFVSFWWPDSPNLLSIYSNFVCLSFFYRLMPIFDHFRSFKISIFEKFWIKPHKIFKIFFIFIFAENQYELLPRFFITLLVSVLASSCDTLVWDLFIS